MKQDCPHWYSPNEECLKITRMLNEDVFTFIGTMKGQQRSCCGIKAGCLFIRAHN